MKLSVIIPYYNAEKYVFTLLESLNIQGFQESEYEIIIVDDGSTHDVERLKEYCQRRENVKYVRQTNGRQSRARNNGMSMAKGDYLFFCDADDELRHGSLSKAWKVANENHLDFLFFNRVIIREKESPPLHTDDFTIRDIMNGQQYYGSKPNMSLGVGHYIVSSNFIKNNKLYFPDGILSVEDASFTIDSLIAAKKVGYINVDVYFWIQHPESISHYEGKKKMAEQYNKDRIWFIEKYKKVLENQSLDTSCFNSIKNQMEVQAFALLHNSLRYLPISNSKEFIKQLKDLGEYPFGKHLVYGWKYTFINKVMNCYSIWIACCWLFTKIPSFIKRKL